MDILERLNQLEELVETAGSIPFSGNIAINKEELLSIISDLRKEIPTEIQQANLIRQEEDNIIKNAQADAKKVIDEAKKESQNLLDENYIMQLSYEKGEEIVNQANEESAKIRQGARNYADEVLQNTQENLSEVIRIINENRQQLKN